MADLAHPGEEANKTMGRSLEKPVSMMLLLFVLASLVKIVDTFFLPVNELVGELIVTKALGFLLVAAYVWLCGRQLKDIGIHGRRVLPSLFIGILVAGGIVVIAHAIQYFVFLADDPNVRLVFSAVDPKTGLRGGFWFGVWLVAANLVNVAMEDGLFRGLMIRHFLIRYRFRIAMLLQVVLFAIWHMNWPVQHWISGESTLGEALFEASALLLSTSIAAIVLGYLYYKTNNLWSAFVAHFINNGIFNVLFFETAEGLQTGTEFWPFRIIYLLGYLAMIPIIILLANRYQLPDAQPWGRFEEDEAEIVAERIARFTS